MAAIFALAVVGWLLGRVLGDADGFFDELGQWDAAWYRDIALSGYGSIPEEAIRFFALFPAIGAAVDVLAPWSVGATLLVVAWVSAFLGLRRAGTLAEAAQPNSATRGGHQTRKVGRLTMWTLALWPASISLIMAYPTGITLLATSAVLVALNPSGTDNTARSQGIDWAQVAMWTAVASLARPTGLLLVVPIGLVLLRDRPNRLWPWLSLAAPFVGAATMSLVALTNDRSFTAWSDVQEPLRGSWVNPISRVATGLVDIAGRDFLDGLHLCTVLILIALTIVSWRRLPLAWAAHATTVLLVAISVENWNSLERYAYDMPQLALAAALLLQNSWKRRVGLLSVIGAIGVVGLVMSGEFVP